MNANPKITVKQLRRLQTLYSQYATHAIEGSSREARLTWASELTGRAVASFSALTYAEAKHLINGLVAQLPAQKPQRRRLSRDAAHRAGTDGRRGSNNAQPQMVSAEDLAVIESYYMRLGWGRTQFDAWLSSQHSPLSKRARPVVATAADANRVRWALKGMLQQRGLWEDRSRTAVAQQ
jgi:hypothetical protein